VKDPILRSKVNADYTAGVKRIEKRILGMSSNEGVRFRNREKENLIRKLAAEFKLEAAQIRRMIARY
jgi:hypothetical protein